MAVAKILGPGFGCKLLGYDPEPNPACRDLGLGYVDLKELIKKSDIVSLHAPLLPATAHLINEQTIAHMKKGVMLLGLDVYEEETELFFEDLSLQVIPDDVFSRLLTLPNVVITGHQAFLTREALEHIAQTTIGNILEFAATATCSNQVRS